MARLGILLAAIAIVFATSGAATAQIRTSNGDCTCKRQCDAGTSKYSGLGSAAVCKRECETRYSGCTKGGARPVRGERR